MVNTSISWIKKNWQILLFCLAILVVVIIAIQVNLRFWELDTVGTDTYYSWVEGDRILRGRNPYERILNGNMEENEKYSTYLPLFYEASAVTQYLGLEYYPHWIGFWRYIFLVCNIAVGLALAIILYFQRKWALALLGLTFWYFNRWTLHSSATVALDFIPIFLMILSLGLHDKYRRISLILFGVSLATKQIAIFLLPLFIIWEYQDSRSIWKTFIAGLWVASVPLLVSIPFLFWSAEGFIRSIAFSATRIALNHFDAESLDVILGLRGLMGRIPFLAVLCLSYLVTFQKEAGRYGSAVLVMAVFVAFNSVLFTHYPTWLMPLLPLAAGEWLDNHKIGS